MWNKEGKGVLEFCAAMDLTVGNALFKKTVSHLAPYGSASSRTQVDYCLVKRSQMTFLKDIKVLPSEECINQDKPLLCDLKQIIKIKQEKFETRRKRYETT